MDRLDLEVRNSRDAVDESARKDEEVRRLEKEASLLLAHSRKLVQENHFGEMIDEAFGVSHRRHA